MNRNKLKTYAPEARRDFIQAMKDRAAFYGLTASKIEPAVVRGDVAVIAGRDYPRAIADKREKLEARVERDGFEQTMEALAYTWFNRLVAIRFMEVNGYLDHGYRVLSHPDGKQTPEILEHAEHVELPGLKKDRAIDLKLEGNRESELYRLLLTAQCNALHKAMPFLFERIDDETELLLPDNLLHSDSLIRKMVDGIDEDDWKEVEVIGWLYQFYISERKDEVIGKVVASADIPAATQLFTPNWIVKYLVQNTLGRQWLATYPNSALRVQMEYYIEPAEQTAEVAGQIKAITPESLDPETLTMLDPACGSCHILVEGYDLFKAIYLERGYRLRDIPALILQKNLFGLEIDDRAAQLGAFALMMKARADDRRIFESDAKPNVLSFQNSDGIDATSVSNALNSTNQELRQRDYLFEEIDEAETPLLTRKAGTSKEQISKKEIASLLALFEHAKTCGSLIQVPSALASRFMEIEDRLDTALKHGDLEQAAANSIKPLLQQARILASRYDSVVANPPYMGSSYFEPYLKDFVSDRYAAGKSDLYACFIQRNLAFALRGGYVGMITIPNWMFLSSFEKLRTTIFSESTIDTFVHNGRGVWGSDFGSCSFVVRQMSCVDYVASYRRLFERAGSVSSNEELSSKFHVASTFHTAIADLVGIPDTPLSYWVTPSVRAAFHDGTLLGDMAEPRLGMATGDNDKYVRFWHEVSVDRIGFNCASRGEALESKRKWFPYHKGGQYRRWFGNNEFVVNWENDGKELQTRLHPSGRVWAHNFNLEYIFRPCIEWSRVSSTFFGVRFSPPGFLFDTNGSAAFVDEEWILIVLGLLCSKLVNRFTEVLNPTVVFQAGDVGRIPVLREPLLSARADIEAVVAECIQIATADWNRSETSWEFSGFFTVENRDLISESFQESSALLVAERTRMKHLEETNNRLLAEVYSLSDEVTPEIEDEAITLTTFDAQGWCRRMLSYAIGCVMGRFGVGKSGLLCAHSSRSKFEFDEGARFKADDDGIVPVLDKDWGFQDDASTRIVEFVSTIWSKTHLEENLRFVAESLEPNAGLTPRDAIRRYLVANFYKSHLSLYKRRPIYWMFSSGKSHAFQCLVYLHRYHEGTLARMRTAYVIPLQGQMASRIDQIESEKVGATSTSHRKKLQKEQDELRKQQAELLSFEAKLKHFADQKISLDLDDGVKVNYGKFGDLLAEVKAITGGKDDE
jgi:hypothetical protein